MYNICVTGGLKICQQVLFPENYFAQTSRLTFDFGMTRLLAISRSKRV